MTGAGTGPGGTLAERLLSWYDQNARALPWRMTDDPYRILVSEFMLQQTQVKTVVPYYLRFIGRFPDPETLARAPLDEVLAEWKGLGYYRRARMLHEAARAVVERHGGRIPRSAEELTLLPGVGEYTACAVASIAFGEPVPTVDGNVLRVMARLLDHAEPVDKASSKHMIAGALREMIPAARPGDFNQAMMELGATVCAPLSPRCGECPLACACRALAAGTVGERPVRARPKPPRSERRLVGVPFLGASVLLVRRPEGGLLGGLWEFPNVSAGDGEAGVEELRRAVEEASGRSVVRVEPSGRVEHRFSHRIWRMEVHRLEVAPDGVSEAAEGAGGGKGARLGAAPERVWVDRSRVLELALPKAMQKVWEAACGPAQLTF